MPQKSSGSDQIQFNGLNSTMSGSTPNAAVLCDINGTPQWCHDGTTFQALSPHQSAMQEIRTTSLGSEFRDGLLVTVHLGVFALGMLVPLALVAALVYTTYRAYFVKRRK